MQFKTDFSISLLICWLPDLFSRICVDNCLHERLTGPLVFLLGRHWSWCCQYLYDTSRFTEAIWKYSCEMTHTLKNNSTSSLHCLSRSSLLHATADTTWLLSSEHNSNFLNLFWFLGWSLARLSPTLSIATGSKVIVERKGLQPVIFLNYSKHKSGQGGPKKWAGIFLCF